MAVSSETITQLYQFFAIAFDAAPGTTYMGQLTDAVNAGMSVKDIVNVFTTKSQFTSVYPTTLSTSDEFFDTILISDVIVPTTFATRLVANVVGASASNAAKAEAVANIQSALHAGWSRGDVIFQVFSNLAAKAADDATWGATSKLMANQVAVAQYATEVKQISTANLADLQAIISTVTDTTDVSTPAAIEAVITAATRPAGQTFTLTTGSDALAGYDTINGLASNDTIDGGTDDDYIEGGRGADQMNFSGDGYVSFNDRNDGYGTVIKLTGVTNIATACHQS